MERNGRIMVIALRPGLLRVGRFRRGGGTSSNRFLTFCWYSPTQIGIYKRIRTRGNSAKDHGGSGNIRDSDVSGDGGDCWSVWDSRSVVSSDMRQSLRVPQGTVHVKGCSTPFAKGNAVGTSLATGGTISWAGKHPGSVWLSGSVTSAGQGSCAAGSKEYDASDVVTAVTGSAASVIKVGDGGSGAFCVSKAGHLALVKGSVFSV